MVVLTTIYLMRIAMLLIWVCAVVGCRRAGTTTTANSQLGQKHSQTQHTHLDDLTRCIKSTSLQPWMRFTSACLNSIPQDCASESVFNNTWPSMSRLTRMLTAYESAYRLREGLLLTRELTTQKPQQYGADPTALTTGHVHVKTLAQCTDHATAQMFARNLRHITPKSKPSKCRQECLPLTRLPAAGRTRALARFTCSEMAWAGSFWNTSSCTASRRMACVVVSSRLQALPVRCVMRKSRRLCQRTMLDTENVTWRESLQDARGKMHVQ